jgi:hypothetical protein
VVANAGQRDVGAGDPAPLPDEDNRRDGGSRTRSARD